MSAKGSSSTNPSKGKGVSRKRKVRDPLPQKAFDDAEKQVKIDGYHSDEDDIKKNPRVGSKRWSANEEMVLAMAVNAEKSLLKNSFEASAQGHTARRLAWRRVRGKYHGNESVVGYCIL